MKKFPLKLICFTDIHFSLWADAEIFWGFPGGSAIKNPPANAGATGDMSSVPELGRSPGGVNGNLLQYSCLGNPMTEEPGRLQSMGLQSPTWLKTYARIEGFYFSLTVRFPKTRQSKLKRKKSVQNDSPKKTSESELRFKFTGSKTGAWTLQRREIGKNMIRGNKEFTFNITF